MRYPRRSWATLVLAAVLSGGCSGSDPVDAAAETICDAVHAEPSDLAAFEGFERAMARERREGLDEDELLAAVEEQCGRAVAAITAASQSDPHPETPETPETPEPTDADGETSQEGDEGLGTLPVRLQNIAYEVGGGSCQPFVPAEIDGRWLISAMADPEPTGTSMELTLWDGDASHIGSDYTATATVIPPDRSAAYDTTVPFESESTNRVYFPGDFPDADAEPHGIYTVLWRVDGRLASCTGFEYIDSGETAAPAVSGAGEAIYNPEFVSFFEPVSPQQSSQLPQYEPSDAGCDDVGTDGTWEVTSCAENSRGVAVLWKSDSERQVVLYVREAGGPSRPVMATGVLHDWVYSDPIVHAAGVTDSIVIKFVDPAASFLVYTFEVFDSELSNVGGVVYTDDEVAFREHDEGFFLESANGIVADVRPSGEGWRVSWR